MRVFDRARCAATATARRRRWIASRTCCATRRSGCSTGWTTPPAVSRRAGRGRPRRGGAAAARPRHRGRELRPVAGDGGAERRAGVAADEEFLPFAPASFDLVVASLSLHWVNDLPGALIQLRQALRPDGLLLASLPALGTLDELRRALTEAEAALTGGAAPRVSPFPDLRDCAGLLQRAGFALPVADVEDIRLRYADPLALLQRSARRRRGERGALRDRRIPPRELFPAALAATAGGGGAGARRRCGMAVMTGWAPPAQA